MHSDENGRRPAGYRSPDRILISGSSGFIGRALIGHLTASGYTVVPLLRGKSSSGNPYWNPGSGTLNPAVVSGFDTVIHLAGEPVVGRWTDAKKCRILESRSLGTSELATALAAAEVPPRVFLCASGINFYGNRGDTILDEDAPLGEGFLAKVCEAWEGASQPLANLARIVNLRIGVVLSPYGGTMSRVLPIFRLGLGGVVAGGHGYISWISLKDLVRAVEYLINADQLTGPINIVSPHPVMARIFSEAIAVAVGRSVLISVPGWPVRLLLGEMAEETVLSSVRALPKKLLDAGFEFNDSELEEALAAFKLHKRI
jgi:uncharacterized protein